MSEYRRSATTEGMGEGVAYALWRRLEDERIRRGITKTELAELSGKPRTTYNDLATNVRRPMPRIVHAYADALGIDREEAERLAGLRLPSPGVGVEAAGPASVMSVRQAIESSPTFSPAQKRALINMVDVIEAGNRAAHPAQPARSDDEQTAV